METLYDNLPGIDVPVGKVVSTLAEIWEVDREDSANAPSAFRASQMNLVLHFGLGTAGAEARTCFDDAVRFAQRYPCRILVLCPVQEGGDVQLRAKLFAECYVGRSRQEMACCEAIILSYAKESRSYLENQVSTLLESDLPTYYWPHHFFLGRKIQDYLFFVNAAQRVIVDTAVDGEELLTLPWPRPEAVRDLVFARLLPVRQVIGQFLAGFPVATLVDGLAEVVVSRCDRRKSEGRVLLRWLNERLQACALAAGVAALEIGLSETDTDGDCDRLAVEFRYSDSNKRVTWTADLAAKRAEAVADFGGAPVVLTSAVALLKPESALAEAIFF